MSNHPVERRALLIAGAGSLAALAFADRTNAATRVPPEPAAKANPAGRFAGKVVLVTGGTSGIGRAAARACAMEGAKVVFNGRREALGAEVAAAIQAAGGDATFHRSDVSKESEVEALVAAIVKQHGRLDIAYNNAGIENRFARLHEMTEQAWREILDVNTTGQFFCVKHEVRQMLQQGGGVIVNICSLGGFKAFPELGPYIVSNHGRLGLTRVAALEYAKDNIRVASLAPGLIDTPMLDRLRENRGGDKAAMAASTPLGRLCTPEEMARVVLLLAGDDATALHGSNVDATAGLLD